MSESDIYRLALRASPDPVTLSRLRDGMLVDVSDSFCRATGYGRSELIGRRIGDTALWVDAGLRTTLARAVEATGSAADVDIALRRRDGSLRTHRVGAVRLDAPHEPLLLTTGRDITDVDAGAAAALRSSPLRYREFVEAMPLGVLVTQHGDIQFANRKAADLVGLPHEALDGLPFAPLIHEEDRARVAALHERRMRGEVDASSYEMRVLRHDGALRHCRVHVQTVDWGGQPSGLTLLVDITDEVHNDKRLRELSSIVEQSSDAIMLTAVDGTIQYVNPGFERLTGYSSAEVVGRTPAVFKSGTHDAAFYRRLWETIAAGKPFHAQVVNRRKTGELYHAVKTITPMFDAQGRIASYVNIDMDFTAQHEAQQRAAHFATHDPLTGLPNRALLDDRLEHALARHARDATPFALLFADLDGFKAVNDQRGHQAGDDVLKEVARRIGERLRSVDTVARIGGDEFVVLLSGAGDAAAVDRLADELGDAVHAPIELPGGACRVGVSIGVALCPRDGNDAAALLHRADVAMYDIKRVRRAHARA